MVSRQSHPGLTQNFGPAHSTSTYLSASVHWVPRKAVRAMSQCSSSGSSSSICRSASSADSRVGFQGLAFIGFPRRHPGRVGARVFHRGERADTGRGHVDCRGFRDRLPHRAQNHAFLVSELADLAVYEPIRKRGWLPAVVASNIVGICVDSALFLWLAFGSLPSRRPGP